MFPTSRPFSTTGKVLDEAMGNGHAYSYRSKVILAMLHVSEL